MRSCGDDFNSHSSRDSQLDWDGERTLKLNNKIPIGVESLQIDQGMVVGLRSMRYSWNMINECVLRLKTYLSPSSVDIRMADN